jgi:hypothetical protein
MAATEARVRRAALALHTLDGADQARVLAMLEAAQREQLAPVLQELRELGIPPEEPEAGPQGGPGTASAAQRLALLPPAVVAPVLGGLAATTVGALLRVDDWRWAEPALAALPAPHRLAVRAQQVLMPAPGPRLAEALCAAVLDAAEQVPSQPEEVPPARRGWLQRMRSWMR